MTFLSLVLHNLGARKVRSALTAMAVAVGVLTVVTLGLVNSSIRSSAIALMQTGQADFTVAQKGVSDIVNSSVDQSDIDRLRAYPGVSGVVGALLSTTRLNAANPQFLEIGVPPADLAAFGVHLVAGTTYAPDATDQVLLGWRIARDLHAHVGVPFVLAGNHYRVVGLFSTGQSLADRGAMLPLLTFQTLQRQNGEVTLGFVRVAPGTDIAALRARIERDNPQLTTVRTIADFGRADRSLALINAADSGTRVLAVAIGGLVVMSMMTMAFIERIREFGVLSAVGWPRWRVLGLVLSEAAFLGLCGAAAGVVLSFGVTRLLEGLPPLTGILHVVYTRDTFWRALYTAAAMSLLGALYPALRAAWAAPLEALRHE